jgi:hypothetical protein
MRVEGWGVGDGGYEGGGGDAGCGRDVERFDEVGWVESGVDELAVWT